MELSGKLLFTIFSCIYVCMRECITIPCTFETFTKNTYNIHTYKQTSLWILLVSAIVGGISPSDNEIEIGPFMGRPWRRSGQVGPSYGYVSLRDDLLRDHPGVQDLPLLLADPGH